MSEYWKLKEEFDKKVKDLQENCPHTEYDEEQDEFWGIGRTTGARVRYCKRCLYKIYVDGEEENDD
jgi:hypothetical protein